MNLRALINQLAQIRPILQVSRRAVDLVNDDAIRLAFFEKLEHPAEDRAASFGSGLPLFKP